MQDIRPAGGFTRLLAAFLDSIFLAILTIILVMGLGLTQELNRLTSFLRPENLEQVVDEEILMQVDDLEESFSELGDLNLENLPRSTQLRMEEVFRQNMRELNLDPSQWQGSRDPGQMLEQMGELLPRVQQGIQTTLNQLESENLPGLEPEKIQTLRQLSTTVLQGDRIFDVLLALFWRTAPFALAVLYILLGYQGIEALFGASPGKMVFGMKIGNSHGQYGNVLIYLARTILKNIPLGLMIAGFILQNFWFFVGSAGVHLILFFGNFGILGGGRRSLVDALSGAAVYFRRDLKNNQASS